MIQKFFLIACIIVCFTSCVVVKEYQKVNLNDPDMALSDKKCDRNLVTAHSYREAAVGGIGGKTSGGCGCN